jgi:hypothetical protein
MSRGSGTFRVTLTRDLIIKEADDIYTSLIQAVQKILAKHDKQQQELVLQLSHRLSRLPGCKDSLSRAAEAHVIELGPGAAALGTLHLWNHLAPNVSDQETSFFTSRAWQRHDYSEAKAPQQKIVENRRPTHVLYRGLAYPLTETPLLIGLEVASAESGIRIKGQLAGVSRKHCAIERSGDDVIVRDLSTYGTFVDEIRVQKHATLKIGQVIRVGSPGETLQLIASIDTNET